MQLDLAGTTTVITGAATGIGFACARALAAEGARVGLVDRDGQALACATEELSSAGSEVSAAEADVTDEPALSAALETLARRLCGIDSVVGCAGTSGPFGTAVAELSVADWDAVFAVNVTGQFLLAKHALPWLLRSPGPAIVLMASDSAFVAAPGMVPYCASKGAVVQLARALAVDLAGVRVNCVCPSVVDTPMARADLGVDSVVAAGFPVHSAEEVAQHVLYLASPRSRPINGHALLSDFGCSAGSAFPA